jgi:uncharacterized RDD family membrane protein YckC
VRAVPSRISPATYPIAATATAAAYNFEPATEVRAAATPIVVKPGQQELFVAPVNGVRVIPFDSLTSPAEREAIRVRAAETQRPAPLRTAKIESQRPRRKGGEAPDRQLQATQRRLEFQGQEQIVQQPGSHITSDALVATATIRAWAAVIDSLTIIAGLAICLAIFRYAGGRIAYDKHTLSFLAAAILTVPIFYKLLWVFAGRDSLGTQSVKLELVDFDGRKPSRRRRYLRVFGGFVSVLAVGLGLVWALIDEDKLTWHDHISGTFPTFSGEN